MNQAPTPTDEQQATARRGAVRRTVFVLAAIAIVVYVAFVLSGVLGGTADR
jgi:hypothetical protein